MSEREEAKNVTPQDKALAYLQKSGIINAYEYLLTSLCENGLPTGNLYEFAALMMLKYEKRMKTQQRKQQINARQEREMASPGSPAPKGKGAASPAQQESKKASQRSDPAARKK